MAGSDDRPAKPDTGCALCDYVWSKSREEWIPSWNMNCTVHPSPADLLT